MRERDVEEANRRKVGVEGAMCGGNSFFVDDTATTGIYTGWIVGSVRRVYETGLGRPQSYGDPAVSDPAVSDPPLRYFPGHTTQADTSYTACR